MDVANGCTSKVMLPGTNSHQSSYLHEASVVEVDLVPAVCRQLRLSFKCQRSYRWVQPEAFLYDSVHILQTGQTVQGDLFKTKKAAMDFCSQLV